MSLKLKHTVWQKEPEAEVSLSEAKIDNIQTISLRVKQLRSLCLSVANLELQYLQTEKRIITYEIVLCILLLLFYDVTSLTL